MSWVSTRGLRRAHSARASRLTLRSALGYLAALLAIPVAMVFYRTFEHGIGPAWEAVTTPAAQHAFWLTITMVAIAVPLNTIFGIGLALALVRGRWRGKTLVVGDRRPAVRGLAGRRRARADPRLRQQGLDRQLVRRHGVRVIFSTPGMVLATIFVSLPFVVREVVPVLREIGTEQEEAARTLGASRLADVLARSRCPRSAGASPTA